MLIMVERKKKINANRPNATVSALIGLVRSSMQYAHFLTLPPDVPGLLQHTGNFYKLPAPFPVLPISERLLTIHNDT